MRNFIILIIVEASHASFIEGASTLTGLLLWLRRSVWGFIDILKLDHVRDHCSFHLGLCWLSNLLGRSCGLFQASLLDFFGEMVNVGYRIMVINIELVELKVSPLRSADHLCLSNLDLRREQSLKLFQNVVDDIELSLAEILAENLEGLALLEWLLDQIAENFGNSQNIPLSIHLSVGECVLSFLLLSFGLFSLCAGVFLGKRLALAWVSCLFLGSRLLLRLLYLGDRQWWEIECGLPYTCWLVGVDFCLWHWFWVSL
jgi:hypothetical protein